MNVPPHIRALANDASAESRSVLADWFEEQGDVAQAENLRAGGLEALFAVMQMQGVYGKDLVVIDGLLTFDRAKVDLTLTQNRHWDPAIRRYDRGETSVRVHIEGESLYPLDLRDPNHEVVVLNDMAIVSFRPHDVSYSQHAHRPGVSLDMGGPVIRYEIVDRKAGTMTKSTP